MGGRNLSASAVISAVVLFATAISVHAGTITVTNTNDSGPGSLRQALADANAGDTITFAVTGTIGLTSGELLVDKDVTISGPGAGHLAVDGSAKSRVFHVASQTSAVISGLTITNGLVSGNYPDGSGAGIYNDHATLTINDCVISGNSATNGAGIYNDANNPGDNGDSAFLTVNNTVFSKNTSSGDGGGIYSDVFHTGQADLTVNNSTFTGNSAGENGGGIRNSSSDVPTMASVSLNNTTLGGNSASNEGGGIFNYALGKGLSTIQVNSSSLSGNSAGQGGGICNNSGPSGFAQVAINSSTLAGNSATDAGGVSNLGSSGDSQLQISNSTLSNNSAQTGGGVGNESTDGLAELSISDTTFSGNSATDFGASIYNQHVFSPALNIGNTILNAGVSGQNIYNVGNGRIISQGYNLSSDDGGGYLTGPGDQINTDPLLGPLQDNGGPTLTHSLLPGSPAFDAGDPNFTPPPLFDQRGPGFDRVVNGRLDIGSFEVQSATPTPTPTATPRPTPTPRPRPTPAPRPSPSPRTSPAGIINGSNW